MTISPRRILEPLLIFGLCLGLADLGLAQKGGGRGGKRPTAARIFKKLDKNGDGKLTQDELTDRAARLMKADANGDGAVTLDELKAFLQSRKGNGGRGKGKGGRGKRGGGKN